MLIPTTPNFDFSNPLMDKGADTHDKPAFGKGFNLNYTVRDFGHKDDLDFLKDEIEAIEEEMDDEESSISEDILTMEHEVPMKRLAHIGPEYFMYRTMDYVMKKHPSYIVGKE